MFLQGKLYLYEGRQPGAKLAASESVWTDRRVIRVPPDKIGSAEHVVALCPGVWCAFAAWTSYHCSASSSRPY